jgi:hypothetical protein
VRQSDRKQNCYDERTGKCKMKHNYFSFKRINSELLLLSPYRGNTSMSDASVRSRNENLIPYEWHRLKRMPT